MRAGLNGRTMSGQAERGGSVFGTISPKSDTLISPVSDASMVPIIDLRGETGTSGPGPAPKDAEVVGTRGPRLDQAYQQ